MCVFTRNERVYMDEIAIRKKSGHEYLSHIVFVRYVWLPITQLDSTKCGCKIC